MAAPKLAPTTIKQSATRLWGRLAALAHPVTQPAAPLRRPEVSGAAAQERNVNQVQFTYALIAMAAKLANADGPVVREEFLAFRDVFPMHERRSHKVRQLFFDACFESTPATHYARQVAQLFPNRADLHEEVLERLVSIALADGDMTSEEMSLLKQIAEGLGVSFFTLQRVMGQAARKRAGNPYAVLGIKEDAPEAEVKKRYRFLLRDYHPDVLQGVGAQAEEQEYYARKASAVNAAYAAILKARGWK